MRQQKTYKKKENERMVKISTMADFQKLIDIAKEKNIDYAIFGMENDRIPRNSLPENTVTQRPSTKFYYSYYLTNSIFEAFISGSTKPYEKESITEISSKWGIIPVSKIKLDADGNIILEVD